MKQLSEKTLSQEFIKKHKRDLYLPYVLSNNKHLSLQFIEDEILSMFNYVSRKNLIKNETTRYTDICKIISRNYKLTPEFIEEYYYYNSDLVNDIINYQFIWLHISLTSFLKSGLYNNFKICLFEVDGKIFVKYT